MLSTTDLLQLKVHARDGNAGGISDLVFSDTDWTIRDLIVDSGAWIFGRRLVIGPDMILESEPATGTVEVGLSREEMKSLPGAEDDDALSQPAAQTIVQAKEAIVAAETTAAEDEAAHLHRLSEVSGYNLLCDGETAGTLQGFLIDTVAWDMPVALVRLANADKVVLLPSRLISAITWPERSIQTTVEASTLRNAPAYDSRIQDERVFLPVVTDYYSSGTPAA